MILLGSLSLFSLGSLETKDKSVLSQEKMLNGLTCTPKESGEKEREMCCWEEDEGVEKGTFFWGCFNLLFCVRGKGS